MKKFGQPEKRSFKTASAFILVSLSLGSLFTVGWIGYSRHQELEALSLDPNGQIEGTFSIERGIDPPSQVAVEPAPDQAQTGSKASGTPKSTTSRFLIPDLGVNAKLINVGVTDNGAVDTPKSLWDVGWYSGSSYPGKQGNTLIVGHYSRYGKAVFANLSKLGNGQRITVIDKNGQRLNYQITEVRDFKAPEVPMAELINGRSDGRPRMSIVTCAGQYIKSTKDFTNRTVITAELI
jgi:LPXTG-site transpeptidase (sortase) family protein